MKRFSIECVEDMQDSCLQFAAAAARPDHGYCNNVVRKYRRAAMQIALHQANCIDAKVAIACVLHMPKAKRCVPIFRIRRMARLLLLIRTSSRPSVRNLEPSR